MQRRAFASSLVKQHVARMSAAICGIVIDQPRCCSRMSLRSSGLPSTRRSAKTTLRRSGRGPAAAKRTGGASFFVPSQRGAVRKVAAPWRALTARRHRVWRLAPHGRGARARRRSTAAFSRVRVAHKPQVAVLSRICAELLAVRALAAGHSVRRVRSPKPPRERRVQNRGPQGPPPPAPPPFAPVAPSSERGNCRFSMATSGSQPKTLEILKSCTTVLVDLVRRPTGSSGDR